MSSQAFWETKDAIQAIKHIDEEIHSRVKDALRQAHKLYDQGQFKSELTLGVPRRPSRYLSVQACSLGGKAALISASRKSKI